MSVSRIDRLTSEQEAQLGPWAERWINIGLSTERADYPRAEAALRRCYRYADLPEPRVVVPVPSPMVACTAGPIADHLLATGGAAEPGSDRWREAENTVRARCGQYVGGSLWAYWPAFESFLREVCGLRLEGHMSDRAEAYAELSRSACWYWLGDHCAMISDRPIHIDLDEQGRLHSTARKAIEWPDGWGLYRVGGIEVPGEWVDAPGKVDPRLALTHENAELRRAIVQIIGWDRVLEHTPMEETARDDYGVLLVAAGIDDDGREGAHFVRVVCTTTGRVYHFRVPPGCTTPRHALGWKYAPWRPETPADVSPTWYRPELET